ncbi:hypothetical protein ACF3N7_08920 [Cruoricaptor ignavus]|uniref:hypothetical protein n=1 Tax=Cruoricaptor ignavus TaxID=1118202 RepID=UPI00370D3AAE
MDYIEKTSCCTSMCWDGIRRKMPNFRAKIPGHPRRKIPLELLGKPIDEAGKTATSWK